MIISGVWGRELTLNSMPVVGFGVSQIRLYTLLPGGNVVINPIFGAQPFPSAPAFFSLKHGTLQRCIVWDQPTKDEEIYHIINHLNHDTSRII